jgi:hypothetical protein
VSDGKRVYVYVGNVGLYAYNLDGTRAWATLLGAFPIYLDFSTGGSPVLRTCWPPGGRSSSST